MSMLLPAPEYAPASSVYSPDMPEPMPVQGVAPEPMLLPQEQQQQQPGSNGAMQFGQEYMSQLGAGGGSAGSMMGLPGSAGASAMATPGVAGAMPTTLGGGSVVGPMSTPGMSATAVPASAGGGGGMAALANPLMWIPAAVGAAGHYQEKQGINTWGDHLTDFSGSHVRHGEELDRLSNKWAGDNWLGDNVGKMMRGPMRISSLRPREMWGGFKDTLAPITSIADLWS